MKRTILRRAAAFAMVAFLLATTLLTSGCAAAYGRDLMAELTPGEPITKEPDGRFAAAVTDFSLELLHRSLAEEDVALSPLSVYLALGMTAAGATGETLAEMESVLGLPADELHAYLAAYRTSLTGHDGLTFNVANGIWYRNVENLGVKQAFLQTVLDQYGAPTYAAPFDDSTVREINRFVENATDGMIKDLLSELSQDAMMCLVNALLYKGKWDEEYTGSAIRTGTFTHDGGTSEDVTMLSSTESLFVEQDGAVGFVKPYEDGRMALLAILPPEGVSGAEYAKGLTGEDFAALWKSRTDKYEVRATMPKFTVEYKTELSEALIGMGITRAFDDDLARFDGMAEMPLKIGKVIHKAKVELDEEGTKAAAATAVVMDKCTAAEPIEKPVKTVVLDRSYLWAIVDVTVGIPVFVGVNG